MKVIKEYEPCKNCKGTGLEWDGEYASDCRVCQGYGKNLISIRKEAQDEQLSSGSDRIT